MFHTISFHLPNTKQRTILQDDQISNNNNKKKGCDQFPLTRLEGEVIHHLQPTHHQQVWFEVFEFLSKVFHGVQVGVMVITVDDIPTEHKHKQDQHSQLQIP